MDITKHSHAHAVTTQPPREISGGGKVTVYEKAGQSDTFAALVEMQGERYPEKGIAMNVHQTEVIFVIEGTFTIMYDNAKYLLEKNDVLYLEPNSEYSIQGKGRVFVTIVHDTTKEKGETKLI